MLANDMTDMGLISNIYKWFLQLKKTNSPNLKMGRRTE